MKERLYILLAAAVFAAVSDSAAFAVPDSGSAVHDSAAFVVPDADSVVSSIPDSSAPAFFERLPPAYPALSIDSAMVYGTAYTSFADILDLHPGLFIYNPGSLGQLTQGAAFAFPAADLRLVFDGLRLDDPATGETDLNLVPTLSVDRSTIVCTAAERDLGYLPLGTLVQVNSRLMASLPISSQVSYHTGAAGYDDVDVRLGARVTPVLFVDAGAVIKGYDGSMIHSRYSGQKINLHIRRRVGNHWTARYVLLRNVFDRDRPLPGPLPGAPELNSWHEKLQRTDHGLIFESERSIRLGLQWTAADREQYASRRALLDQTVSSSRMLLDVRYRHHLSFGVTEVGGSWAITRAQFRDTHRQWRAGSWLNLSARLPAGMVASAGLFAEKTQDREIAIQPELSLTAPSFFALWRHSVQPPALAQLYSDDILSRGSALDPAIGDQFLLGVESRAGAVHGLITLSAHLCQHRIVLMAAPWPFYANCGGGETYALDTCLDFLLGYGVRAISSFSLLRSGEEAVNRPQLLGRAELEAQRILFQGDLNVRLKAGVEWLGERTGPQPWYSQNPQKIIKLAPVLVPLVQGIFVVKDAIFYLTFENPFDFSYQRIYGYPMPGPQFRWGFIWKFAD